MYSVRFPPNQVEIVTVLVKDSRTTILQCLLTYGSVRVLSGPLTSKIITTLTHANTSYRLSPSIGSTKPLSGSSCKHIRDQLSTDCHHPPTSGVYWVQNIKQVNIRTYKHTRLSTITYTVHRQIISLEPLLFLIMVILAMH